MRILIGTPTYDRRVDIEMFKTIINIERQGTYDLDFLFPVSSHIARSRNMCCHEAINGKYDWLLFWDSDIGIGDPGFIEKMIDTAYRYDAQVVCGAYRIKDPDMDKPRYPVGTMKDGKGENMTKIDSPGLVDAGGTGIMLIRREVLLKMEDPWFTIVDGKDLFVMPEDWEFCRKARELGFKIAVDPRFPTRHFGTYPWQHL